jgi:hypothetical protein
MNTAAGTAIEVHSPKTKKKIVVSPTKVNAGEGVGEGGGSDVICGSGLHSLIAENMKRSPKLVIFNIHGSLLNCSMRKEKNPNPNIRYIVLTESRRVVFRPGLREFLSKCFINFTVAFWDSKSESYTNDVMLALLGRVERPVKYCPLFVWSGKNCEATGIDDGAFVIWGKSVAKVFEQWPTYNITNTLIVDHKGFRVGCNAPANVIITIAFYVSSLGKLGDDRNYLKESLWPLLECFASTSTVYNFREYFPFSFIEPGVKVPKFYERLAGSEVVDAGSSEGTSEPHGSAFWVSPHLLYNSNTNCGSMFLCRIKWRKWTSGTRGRWLGVTRLRWTSGRQGRWEQQGGQTSERTGRQ